MSILAVLQTPVTWAPKAFAIWTAKGPTLPDAPLISTLLPGLIRSPRLRPWMARMAACGMVAASSKVRLAGIRAQACSGAHAYSAKAP